MPHTHPLTHSPTHTHTHMVKRTAGSKRAKELSSEHPQIVLVRRGSVSSDNGSPLGAFLQVAINPVHGWGENIMGNSTTTAIPVPPPGPRSVCPVLGYSVAHPYASVFACSEPRWGTSGVPKAVRAIGNGRAQRERRPRGAGPGSRSTVPTPLGTYPRRYLPP